MGNTAVLAAGAPQLTWTISKDVQDVARKISFAIMAIWLVYIAVQFALPSRRMGGGRIGIGKIIGGAVVCVILMDLNLFTSAVNAALTGGWSLWNMISGSRVS